MYNKIKEYDKFIKENYFYHNFIKIIIDNLAVQKINAIY